MAVTIYVVQTLLRDTPRGSDRRLEPSLAAAVSMPRWLFANLLNAGLGGGTMRLYRYRVGGRGFESELAAAEALERALERLGRGRAAWLRRRGCASSSSFTSPSTTASQRRSRSYAGLPAKSVRAFGHRRD